MQGVNAWGKWGIAVSCTGSLPVSLYTGESSTQMSPVLIPHRPEDLGILYEFVSRPNSVFRCAE